MALFKIEDSENSGVVAKETFYYKWLESKQPKDIHSINTKIQYLTEKGFRLGEHTLSEK